MTDSAEVDKTAGSNLIFQLLIIAVLIYIGSYYLLVRKQETPAIELWNTPSSRSSKAEYRWNSTVLHTAFTPIHWADRRIRSKYWGPDGVGWEEPDLTQFQPH